MKHRTSGAAVIAELRNVSRQYAVNRANTVKALDNVSLQIKKGEIVALTGPSGSGKSTLTHLLAGLDRPTSGSIEVEGRAIASLAGDELARYRNQTVGVVFQFFYLQPFLSVARNIEVPLMFARMPVGERPARIASMIAATGLDDRASFFPKELSGGQMQRVAIARALVTNPRLLLADEPTGNLDSHNSDAILEVLQNIRRDRGTTIVVVTHDPRVAAWADRVVQLKDGSIV